MVALTVLAAVVVSAADPIGTWKGTMETNDKTGKFNLTRQMGGKMQLTVVIKKGGAFQATIVQPEYPKPMTSDGKWKVAGQTVVLTAHKADGKPLDKPAETHRLTLAKDGKSMTQDFTAFIKQGFPNEKVPPGIKIFLRLKKV
ncbi:MAG: hypothetical protein KF884_04945 [Fimbriimonadaceae bacterium]|nr:hypothetical protein [Fimbriimonadaceae bacterium]QYK59433.1 MAG: hypothetical protein KF884_04945 [Fimbriimonadaceae bacterium]